MSTKINKQSRHLVLIFALYKGYITSTNNLIIKDNNQLRLIWKQKILNKVNIHNQIIQYNQYYYLITKKYKFMSIYSKIAFKKLTNKLISKLTILDLSILYNDIGKLHFKRKNNIIHAIQLSLYTNVSKETNQQLIDYINNKWQINFFQLKHKDKYYLRCNTLMTKKFLKLINSYYKVDI